MQTRILIPARLASTRLPKKLLRQVGGKSILHHTYLAALEASDADCPPVVAVDDPLLAEEVKSFGGRFVMTRSDCPSGTDRLAEALEALESQGEVIADNDVIVNVQGDEPEIDPVTIRRVAQSLFRDTEAAMGTAATPIRDPDVFQEPSVVKAVLANSHEVLSNTHEVSGQGRAIYFSRRAVPYSRDEVTNDRWHKDPPMAWHHVGLYAYRREFLRWFAKTPPSFLEMTEKLEQLRAIEHAKPICVVGIPTAPAGIDTESDLVAFEKRWILSNREGN